METSPAFSEGKSECRVRVFLESGFCTGPSPGPSPSPVRVSQYAAICDRPVSTGLLQPDEMNRPATLC